MLTTYRKLLAERSETNILKQAASLRKHIDSKPFYFFFKRVFDLFFSTIVILFILSWFIPLMAFLIKIDSKGPAFFAQKRIGRGGRPFLCFKFRTMRRNMEADLQQAVENDYRITRIGRFLRFSSIDELPQFINVFLGHMSIVGPRPHMISDCQKFSRIISGYKFRSLVRPGITGLAQVKGYRGPASSYRNIVRRYQYDAFYIRQANFLLDIRILGKTIVQMFHSLFPVTAMARKYRKEKSAGTYSKAAA